MSAASKNNETPLTMPLLSRATCLVRDLESVFTYASRSQREEISAQVADLNARLMAVVTGATEEV